MSARLFTTGLLLLLAGTSQAQLLFEDATLQAGMTLSGRGQGVAVRDYDKDGWPDLYVATSSGASALFRNRGDGTFEDVAAAAGVALTGGYFAPGWADLDNDGWADLVVVGEHAPNKIFRARGDGTFQDISASSGIDTEARAASLAFGDFNADGLVDLFLPVDGGPDLLYRNLGAGRFEDVSAQAGIGGVDYSVAMQATWFDFDHDGSQDLFVVHDGSIESRLHRNLGYLPLLDQAGIKGFSDVGSGNSMGMAWADVDGDGWEDVYVTRIGVAGLYMYQQGNGFVQIEDALGAWRNGMSWGTVFADFDNDLDPDLFVVNTTGYDGTRTLLYENRNLWFYDKSQSAGASLSTETQGLASFDYDLDGLVDLVMPDHNGQVRVLRGATPSPGNWLKIQLKGTSVNRDAIGTRVEAQIGDRLVTRFVSGGDSYCSQSEPVLHFGIGGATRVDRLVVHWGRGHSEVFEGLSAGNHILTQGAGSPVGTSRETEPEIPGQTPVIEAFPNPFAADTQLRVHLPTPLHVRVSLYDARGRKVALLLDRALQAGQTNVGLSGSGLGTGIYFAVLETEAGVTTTAISHVR